MFGRKLIISLCAAGTFASGAFAQTMLYVDRNANLEPHDGSSWCHAYLEVHEALAVAGPNTVIRVADGTYLPDSAGLGDPREATFQLASGVLLEGGYAGCGAPDPDDLNPRLHETTLSGDLNGDDAPDGVNRADNSYHVVTGSGTGATAELNGFLICGGNADGTEPHDSGGGMLNMAGSPTVTECVFKGNSAEDCGGAVFNDDDSDPNLAGCLFVANSANDGGGMCNDDDSNATLTDCVFTENTSSRGGGLYDDRTASTLVNCTFIRNSVIGGNGGGMSVAFCSPTLTQCTFIGNTADSDGGGVFVYGGSATFTNCTFSGNSAEAGTRGGGLFVRNTSPTLTNCIFSDNSAYEGGGMCIHFDSDPTLANCTFSRNSASYQGGGLSSFGNCSPTLVNCIVWGNTAPDAPQIADDDDGATTATYSCIESGWPGTGNVDVDPCLDFALRPAAGSACIDAGDNTAVPADTHDLDGDGDTAEPVPLDALGMLRFHDDLRTHDTGVPGTPGPIVDMGACEYGSTPPPPVPSGDMDGDGDVDGVDIQLFILALLYG